MATTRKDQILKMFRKTRGLRARDFASAGIAREYLSRMMAVESRSKLFPSPVKADHSIDL